MKDMKLDKNYNFFEVKNVYEDDLVVSVDLIVDAQSRNIISSDEANLLFKIVLKKEIKKEAKSVIPSTKNSTEIHSFFMNMKSKQIKHA